MSSSYNIYARLRSVARARTPAVHVRGAGEHRASAAQRLPAYGGRSADPWPYGLLATQRQGSYACALFGFAAVALASSTVS